MVPNPKECLAFAPISELSQSSLLSQYHFIQSMLKWKMMLCYHKAA